MDRRFFTALTTLALAAAAIGPTHAQTQAQPTQSQSGSQEAKHITDTLMAGFVSIETSRVAISKASGPMIKRFAQFESAEQETIAMVLKARGNIAENAKPQIEANGRAMIDKLHDIKTGPDFDKAYVEGQLEGHKTLLLIQETYLSNGKDEAHRGIAMLARGHIREHIAYLETMRKDMAG